MSGDQMTFVLHFYFWCPYKMFNKKSYQSVLHIVFEMIFDCLNYRCVLQLLIMFPLTISNAPTLVLPCLPWPKTCFSPQGYKAQWRDVDLLTSTNTGQQTYLHKLAHRRKESSRAERQLCLSLCIIKKTTQ